MASVGIEQLFWNQVESKAYRIESLRSGNFWVGDAASLCKKQIFLESLFPHKISRERFWQRDAFKRRGIIKHQQRTREILQKVYSAQPDYRIKMIVEVWFRGRIVRVTVSGKVDLYYKGFFREFKFPVQNRRGRRLPRVVDKEQSQIYLLGRPSNYSPKSYLILEYEYPDGENCLQRIFLDPNFSLVKCALELLFMKKRESGGCNYCLVQEVCNREIDIDEFWRLLPTIEVEGIRPKILVCGDDRGSFSI